MADQAARLPKATKLLCGTERNRPQRTYRLVQPSQPNQCLSSFQTSRRIESVSEARFQVRAQETRLADEHTQNPVPTHRERLHEVRGSFVRRPTSSLRGWLKASEACFLTVQLEAPVSPISFNRTAAIHDGGPNTFIKCLRLTRKTYPANPKSHRTNAGNPSEKDNLVTFRDA